MTTKSHLMSNWNLEKVYEELAKDGVRIFDKYSYVHPTKTDNKSIRLSLGRIWFNCLFPQDFDFVNEKIPKSELDKIFSKIANKYPPAKAAEILNRVQVEAFKMATLEPRSMSTEMFEPSEEWTAKQQEFVNNADDLTDKQYAKRKVI